jgi:Uma2 family endonuclease
MSAARSLYPYSSLLGLTMTADEYLALGETPERTELLNGVVISMSPSPIPRHFRVVQEILLQLGDFDRHGERTDVYADIDVKIRELAVLRPDLCVYARPRSRQVPDRLLDAPDLIVEVLSPGSEAYDLVTKKSEYEQRGVREYWVIDPATAALRAWHRESNRFIDSPVEGASFPSRSLSGFTLNLAALARAVGVHRP